MSEQFRSYWAVLPGEVAHDRELTTGPPIARRAEAKSGQMTWEDLSGRPDQGFPFAPWQPNIDWRKIFLKYLLTFCRRSIIFNADAESEVIRCPLEREDRR